ncbi:MAG TPA: preprotein translocase subunit SecG [Anaeromyxobacter sp.]|nr:preprotein translocase subunit SecG [Anaeromyxobacter sp.]
MITFVTIIHVVVCVFLILVILLQAGKGGGMGAGLGGASQTVFGGRGSQSFLGRLTSISAGIFMLTSVWLAYHSSRNVSVVEEPPAPAPAAPAPGTSPAPKEAAPPAPTNGQPAPAPAGGQK